MIDEPSIDSLVQCGAAQLAVSSWGSGGSPIVALHPGVGDRRIWKWCAPSWVHAGRSVIAYDRRGFGTTHCEPEPHDDLQDLIAVMSATKSAPATIVGNSRGGGLALDLALAHPDHVSRLILIAPSLSGYDYSGWPTSNSEAAQDDLIAAAERAHDLNLLNGLEVRYWLDGSEQSEGRVGGEARALMLEMNGLALRAEPVGDATSQPNIWDRLEEIQIPTLVLVGEHDLPGIRHQCDELAAALSNATFATIAGSAHCPSLDQPASLSQLVLDFVS